jgi:hypothetical protein
MDDGRRRAERLRSFLFGGLIGASAVIAAARRRRRPEAPRHAAGLGAFEDAPCYRETIEREAVRGQEELEAGRPVVSDGRSGKARPS